MKKPIYALYRGEKLLCDGTIKEIAEHQGVKVNTIKFYKTKSYKKRIVNPEKRKILVEIE